ncbi:MAG: hypothetical protein R3C27_11165 [Hyphomonadaceae bacterium]
MIERIQTKLKNRRAFLAWLQEGNRVINRRTGDDLTDLWIKWSEQRIAHWERWLAMQGVEPTRA